MAALDDYFQSVVNIFASITPFAEFVEEPVVNGYADELGMLTFGLKFLDDSIFYFTATVDYSAGYPAHTNYSLHYQDKQGHCIFRYDNTPHYPSLAPFPQHKHLGKEERAVDAGLPSMRQVAREITEALERNGIHTGPTEPAT
jgi:hypothetical protein